MVKLGGYVLNNSERLHCLVISALLTPQNNCSTK